MRTNDTYGRSVFAAIAATALTATGTAAQAPLDVQAVLTRVGERVAEYYRRVQNVICIEKTTVQPITHDFSLMGFLRVTESELHIEPGTTGDGDGATGATVVRRLLRINGRAPRDKDKTDHAGCTDPNPLSPEPLAFLLPANREDYKFSSAGFGKGKERDVLFIDFMSLGPSGEGTLVEDVNGRPDCFSWTLPVQLRGRVWIDTPTYDVLRVEIHLASLATIKVSARQQIKHGLPTWIVIDRYDRTIRYKTIAFKDPDDAMLLPESIETLLMVRSALQSIRKQEQYSGYRRFVTGGQVVKD